MREDLDFLFDKAMRSKDVPFMQEVAVLVAHEGWDVDLDALIERINNFSYGDIGAWPNSRFQFLVGELCGNEWYTNRESIG